jgi:hypothetical protein
VGVFIFGNWGNILARINFEDSIFKEKAFEKLMFKLGSKRSAMGALMEGFILAQDYYLCLENNRLIPIDVWKREEIADELIEFGYAVVHENGIYMRGSKDQFSWLIQKSEAGRKGGLKRAENAKLIVPATDQATSSVAIASLDGPKPLTLTLPKEEEKNMSEANASDSIEIQTEDGKPKPIDLIDLWNDIKHPSLPAAAILTPDRERQARAILKKYPDIEFWKSFIGQINKSEFCLGRFEVKGNRSKPWKANFDWILKLKTIVKFIEGGI